LKVYASESEHAEAEYFRPGLDADYAMLKNCVGNLSVYEVNCESKASGEISESDEGSTIHAKAVAWGHTKNRFLSVPTIVATKRGETMVEALRRHRSEISFKGLHSYTNELVSSLQCKMQPLSGPDLNMSDKYISEDIKPELVKYIYSNLTKNETISSGIYSEGDIIQPEDLPRIEHKYKMKSLVDFFGKEIRSVSVKVNDRLQILRELCYRWNAYALQNIDGTYSKQDGDLSDELLQDHLDGKITIGAYNLGPENKVRWLCFDVDAHRDKEDTDYDFIARQVTAEKSKNKICNFLSERYVPFMLEASGTLHSYHVWIFLKPVDALFAKAFGKAILKELGINKMEVYPNSQDLPSLKN